MASTMPSDPPAYRAYDTEDEDTTTPHASGSRNTGSVQANRVDELLPVPVTLQPRLSPNSQPDIRSSFLRIGSVGVIVIFLLTITFYGTAVVGTVDESLGTITGMKGVISSLVHSLGGSLKGVEDDMSGDLESLKLDGTKGTQEVPSHMATDIWNDTELSEIQVAPLDGYAQGLTPPDWSRYTFLRTLRPSSLELDKPETRLIFIGDIHGSFRPLKKLMKKLSFDPSHDKLIHVGDVIAKGPEPHAVLDYLRKNRVKGVRGNHDEKVIEWGSWMRWAGKGYRSGSTVRSNDDDEEWKSFIDDLDDQFPPDLDSEELSDTQREQLEKTLAAKAKSFPKSWSWRSEHWKIARGLSKENYQYLVDLPLTLHLPSVHSIVVHAGLLARDPTKKATSNDQPYAAAIASGVTDTAQPGSLTRAQAEVALLRTIPQNRDPYTLLNIRSVLKDGETTKNANKGTPWSDIWQEEMSTCTGPGSGLVDDAQGSVADDEDIDRIEDEEKRSVKGRKKGKELPKKDCSPVTVIYGHAAGRGLDIKQYSKGLDSGCVYGRQLTALILSGDIKATRKIKGAKSVQVGTREGVLVDIECEKATSGKPE